MGQLKEFYDIMIEYPWCTLFTFLGLLAIVANFNLVKICNINYKLKKNHEENNDNSGFQD